MAKWSYMQIMSTDPLEDNRFYAGYLSELGRQGWELCGVLKTGFIRPMYTLYLKRLVSDGGQ